MKSEQLMTLALRVVAVIIAAYACADLSNVVSFLIMGMHWLQSTDEAMARVGEYAVLVWSIPVIVALLLWWLAPRLAKLACRDGVPDVNFSGLDIQQLTRVAFVLVGFWVAVYGLIGLVSIGVNELQIAINFQLAGEPFAWSEFATYILRFAFGLGVVAGGRNLSRLMLHIRTAGTE